MEQVGYKSGIAGRGTVRKVYCTRPAGRADQGREWAPWACPDGQRPGVRQLIEQQSLRPRSSPERTSRRKFRGRCIYSAKVAYIRAVVHLKPCNYGSR